MSIEKFKPDHYLERIYQINVSDLTALGVKLLLIDLDNTLIAWNHPDGTDEMRDWLKEIRTADVQLCVVSNNHYKRVKRAVAPFDLDFINDALKPFSRGIRKACQRYGISRENTLMVGDQKMTDIHAANRAGVQSILVKPLIQTDHWSSKINRMRERRVTRKITQKYGKAMYLSALDL